jgi:hypothetical protein
MDQRSVEQVKIRIANYYVIYAVQCSPGFAPFLVTHIALYEDSLILAVLLFTHNLRAPPKLLVVPLPPLHLQIFAEGP